MTIPDCELKRLREDGSDLIVHATKHVYAPRCVIPLERARPIFRKKWGKQLPILPKALLIEACSEYTMTQANSGDPGELRFGVMKPVKEAGKSCKRSLPSQHRAALIESFKHAFGS